MTTKELAIASSTIWVVLAAILAIFVFVFGPTVTQLNILPTSIGAYLNNFFEMASWTGVTADGTAGEWLGGWTIFYWAWWVSWSPFVGMFLARISRGRSIREFLLGVLLIPAGLSTVWFSIFGGTAIWMENNGQSIVGDGTTEAISRLTEVGVGESLESTRDRVAAALERIAEGTYGLCESCGDPIDPRRLAVAPESVLCIDCARSAQRR